MEYYSTIKRDELLIQSMKGINLKIIIIIIPTGRSQTKEYILYDSIYKKNSRKGKLICSDRK